MILLQDENKRIALAVAEHCDARYGIFLRCIREGILAIVIGLVQKPKLQNELPRGKPRGSSPFLQFNRTS
jgi:hypothetical protein